MLILHKIVLAAFVIAILTQGSVKADICSDLPVGLEPFTISETSPIGPVKIQQITNIRSILSETPTDTSKKIHECFDIGITNDNLNINLTKNLSGVIDHVEFYLSQSNEARFRIICSDGKGKIGTIRVEDENNQPPKFNRDKYEFKVNESFPTGIPLNFLGENEPIIIWDSDFPPGKNNILTSVEIKNDDDGDDDMFDYHWKRIDATNEYKDKALKINNLNLVLKKKLDYQKKATHQLTITVSDGLNIRSANIQINVTDEDDKPPKFSNNFYQAVFNENKVEIFPESIKAVDGDTEMNHSIVYSIVDEDITAYLEINKDTGEITVKDLKTLKDKGYFLLIIRATENVYPFHSTTVPVFLRFKPEFGSRQYDAFVLNSTEVPKHVITVNAGGNFIYKLTDDTGPFTINEASGDIILKETYNKTKYIIHVEARFPELYKLNDFTSTTKVKVNFLGENTTIEDVACDKSDKIFEKRMHKFTIEGSITGKYLIGKLENATSITDVQFSFSSEDNPDSKYFELNDKGELFTNEEFTQNEKNLYVIRVKAETNSADQESKTDEAVVVIEVTDVVQPPKFCQNQILVGITRQSSFGYSFTMLTPSYTCLKGHGTIEYELTPEQKLIHIDKKSGQLYLLPHNYDEIKKNKPIELNVTATYSTKSSLIPLKVYFPTIEEDFIFQVPLTSESSMTSSFCSFKDHLLKIIKATDIGFIRKELSEDGKQFLFHVFAVNGTEILDYGRVARLADFEAGKEFGSFSLFSAKQLQQQRDERIAVDADSSLTAVVILAALLFVSIILGFLIWYRHREEMQRMNSMQSKLLENEETYHIDSPKKSSPSTSKEDERILKLPYNEESSTDWFMPMVGKRDTVMNDEIVEFANHLLQLDGKITVDMFLKNDSKDHARNNNSSKYSEVREDGQKDSGTRLTNGKSHHLTSEDNQHLPEIQEVDGQLLEARGLSKLDKKADSESPLPLKAIIRMPDQPIQQPRRRSVVTFNDQPEVIRVDTNEAITIASL